jgi:hypothetical protein
VYSIPVSIISQPSPYESTNHKRNNMLNGEEMSPFIVCLIFLPFSNAFPMDNSAQSMKAFSCWKMVLHDQILRFLTPFFKANFFPDKFVEDWAGFVKKLAENTYWDVTNIWFKNRTKKKVQFFENAIFAYHSISYFFYGTSLGLYFFPHDPFPPPPPRYEELTGLWEKSSNNWALQGEKFEKEKGPWCSSN